MSKTDEPQRSEDGPVYAARDARQGDIVLRRRWQRILFIGGLVGLVLIAIAAALLR